jgi:hypothetical protein
MANLSGSTFKWLVCCAAIAVSVGAQAQTVGATAKSSASSSAASTTKASVKKPAATSANTAEKSTTTAATKGSNDRLELDTTTVSGNRDLPKVQYIVPWKKADVGNLPGQPFNTLLDEALTPVDREVFQREVEYYHAVSNKDQPGKGYAGARTGTPPAQSDAK